MGPLYRSVFALGLLLGSPSVWATCGNGVLDAGEACDDGSANGSENSCCTPGCAFSASKEPDLAVSDIPNVLRYGSASGITAYAVGAKACNLGSCWLRWQASLPSHPVIAQNVFRLENGRFQQLGQSWLKHTFAATTESGCGECIEPPDETHLGVGCGDTYFAYGGQQSMGPKSAVDPQTGVFPYPDARIPTTGNVIFKRLQVHDIDLDPAQHPDARYFVEVQYVTSDDPGTAHGDDNVAYREVSVGAAPYDLNVFGPTEQGKAAIQAWRLADPNVVELHLEEAGLLILAARATPSTPGHWWYEYALQNVTSQRAVRSFTVPIPPGTTILQTGFHDVDYHSGEPFDGTQWSVTVGADAVTWSTQSYDVDPNANALRWGTLYNFRFEADVPPGRKGGTLVLFRPGSPVSLLAPTVAPDPCLGSLDGTACDDDDACTQAETCLGGACTPAQTVVCTPTPCDEVSCNPITGTCEHAFRPDGEPCDDGTFCVDGEACQGGACVGTPSPAPDEVDALLLFQDSSGTLLYWNDVSGSTYEVLRGSLAQLPVGPGGDDEFCVDAAVQGAATFDPEDPSPGGGFWYVVRGFNQCGAGPYGHAFQGGAAGAPRESTTCP